MKPSGTLALLIPCLNEERALGSLLTELKSLRLPIIVVDDGSTDGTLDVALAHDVRVVRHDICQGKGNALRSGWAHARDWGYTGVITLDGDGQHRADDVAAVLDAARQAPQSLVIGARLKGRDAQPARRRRANVVADWAVSKAAGQVITDSQSGLRYYPASVLDLKGLPTDHFVFESAILVESSRQLGARIRFVPIWARYEPTMRPSHFRPVRDIARITGYLMAAILRYAVLGRMPPGSQPRPGAPRPTP